MHAANFPPLTEYIPRPAPVVAPANQDRNPVPPVDDPIPRPQPADHPNPQVPPQGEIPVENPIPLPMQQGQIPPQPNPVPNPVPDPVPDPVPAPIVVPPQMSDYVRGRKEEVERLEVQLRVQKSTQLTFNVLAAIFSVATMVAFVAACIVDAPALLAGSAVICAVAAIYFWYMAIVSEVTVADDISKHLVDILKACRGKITDPQLKELFKKYSKEVVKLNLQQIYGVNALKKEEFQDFITTIGTYFTGLSELRIRGFQNLTADTELGALRTVHLKKLEFEYCNIGQAQMEDICVLTSLRSLVLRSCHELTGDGLRAVARLDIEELDLSGTRLVRLQHTWDELEELAVQHCDTLPEAEREPFMQRVRNNPEYLFDLFEKNHSGSFPILNHVNELGGFRKLKYLTVTHINDEGIRELARNAEKLVSLKILYSPTLKGDTFEELAKLNHFVEIGLTRCPEISPLGIGKLATNKKIRTIGFMDALATFTNALNCNLILALLREEKFFPFEEMGRKKFPEKPNGEPGEPTAQDLTGYWVRELDGRDIENVD